MKSEATSVSRRMSRTRRNNPFERAVRSDLFSRGLRFRVEYPIPGMPRRSCDIAFPGSKIAIFLDGCFWHGCPEHGTRPKSNSAFWRNKIDRNAERDVETSQFLREKGWLVLRYWGHQPRQEIVGDIVSNFLQR